MKIILHYNASPSFRATLARHTRAEFNIVVIKPEDREALDREIRDTEVLFHVLAPVTATMMDAAPRLRLIQKIGVGVDTIDLAEAQKRQIKVANMPGTNSQAVAEMTLLLMLSALRRVSYFDRQTRAGNGWSLAPEDFDQLGEIQGRTIGLFGYGQIARRVASALRALDAQVYYHSRAPAPDAPNDWRSLEGLLSTSDIVSLHIPLTLETQNIINSQTIAQMKSRAVIVNTARGGLIDQDALLEALWSGHVAAAGLDVLAVEPIPPDHPLCILQNVVMTPHIAWLTSETLQRSLDIAIGNCCRLMNDEPLLHQVEPLP